MPPLYTRGGIPVHGSGTTQAGSVVEKWLWSGGVANFIHFHNQGGGALTLSFTEADAEAGRGIVVEGGDTLQLPAEVGVFYTVSALATAFQYTVLLRRG